MYATELLRVIFEATVAITMVLILVLLVRKPLRSAFGAGVAYAAWLVVPVALAAVMLPEKSLAPAWTAVVVAFDRGSMVFPVFADSVQVGSVQWILGFWFAGMLLAVLRLRYLQRAFRRGLGHLHAREDGLLQADASVGLPAVYGVFRPKIVVPADFDVRYSEEERKLIEAHERSHAANGDLQANALVAVLRCVFWFNPLLHAASRHFRHDQELACDQRVIRRHPLSRRSYGEAMFKTQLAAGPLPLGCHWGYGHPLKERIAMLKQPLPSRSRARAGITLLIALSLGTGFTAWSMQPASPAEQATSSSRSMPEEMQGSVPVYPKDAVDKKLSGRVVLLIDVAADGTVTDVLVEHSQPAGVFDASVIDAARKWKFNPTRENGKAVAGRVRVPVDFEIPSGAGAPASPHIPLASR